MTRRDVEFSSEGTVCRGWLHVPERTPAPTVVMAHGFSAVKEMRLDRFAEGFARRGFACLVFDFRNLGASDGELRGDIDPYGQVTDYRNAVSFARTLSEVAAERIGVWGTSYAGGHVVLVGAFDRRVRAVVAQVPALDPYAAGLVTVGPEGIAAFEAALVEERERLYAGGAPSRIPVVGPAGSGALMSTPDAVDWFRSMAEIAPAWRNEITLRSVERMLEYSPARFVDRVAPTPLLMITAERDALVPIALVREAFARAGERKRLFTLPLEHFGVYEDPGCATAVTAAADWFAEHL